ncbi:MAG TPA: hypothetical protein VN513_04700 [Gemmatimonadales bacterium]|nr:hypothetical protein [Gemmatimonadales bacterium]
MKPSLEISMPRMYTLVASLAAALAVGGCDLNVGNPNAPDVPRVIEDPAGLEQLLTGAIRTWVETRENYFIMPLNAQADNYTASWNNAAIRFYSSVGSDCPSRCGWSNSATAPEAVGGPTVEAAWYGYHTVLSSATDVLTAIAAGKCFDTDCADDTTLTSRNRAVARMVQGMALAGIAMLYDSGFAVDENSDLSDPYNIAFNNRAQVRDFALQKFNEAAAEAAGVVWKTGDNWFGLESGSTYTNVQIAQLAHTMAAELIALWPRNAAENAAADWAAVVSHASQGITSTAPFDFEYFIDINAAECGIACIKSWGNSIGTMRVDTRVAKLITTNHQDPWPNPGGNPCPTISPDRRVGNGTWGPTNNFNGYSTTAADTGAGSDFACSAVAIFPPARGQYHQSNLQHVRYNNLAATGERLPGFDGSGQDPLYTREMNDLLWAEGLLRSGGSKVTAATLINNSRVGRGGAGCATPGVGGCGLLPLTGAETDTAMYDALHYEQEIEFMGQGTDPFFNRRRIGPLTAGTPRQMPVPAKEMDVLAREIYTFGGPSGPDMSASVGGGRVRSVGQIFNDYRHLAQLLSKNRH